MRQRHIERKWLTLMAITFLAFSTACGGGGGPSSSPPPPPPPPRPVITTAGSPLPDAAVGQPYSVTLQATSGTPPYTWSLVPNSGQLPSGLTLASNGIISGTPTRGETRSFAVLVKDSPGQVDSKVMTLSSYDLLVISSSALQTGNVGISYGGSGGIGIGSIGGKPPHTWSLAANSGPLPPGISLSSSGTLSGTPTAGGDFPVTFQLTDTAQPPQSATKGFTIHIDNNPIITTATLPLGVVTFPYKATMQAVAGTPPYTWALQNPRPFFASFSINPATGELSGTPQFTGLDLLTVTITDSSNPPKQGTRDFLVQISPLLGIISTVLPDGILNFNYTGTISAEGGIPPYTTRVISGALPPGLSLEALNLIRGTPTSLGTFNFTYEITDSSSPPLQARRDFSIRVNTRVVLQSAAPPEGLEGRPYSFTFNASGGVPPYTWSTFTLPAGLTLNANSGVLGGTPFEEFNNTIIIRVNDNSFPPQGDQIMPNLKITGALRVATSQLSAIKPGNPIRIQLAASGGTPPVTWSLLSGNLPAGLTFNPATVEITGTPTQVESSSFTVRVVDSGVQFPQTAARTLTLGIVAAPGRNDSIATATPLSNGTYRLSLSPLEDATGTNPDVDFFALTANPGAIVSVEITAERLTPPSPVDSVIEFVDSTGRRLFDCDVVRHGLFSMFCMNDDDLQTGTIDSKLFFRAPGLIGSGPPVVFYVRVLDWRGMARPDFIYAITVAGAN